VAKLVCCHFKPINRPRPILINIYIVLTGRGKKTDSFNCGILFVQISFNNMFFGEKQADFLNVVDDISIKLLTS
jgi:hypothetical protein